MKCREIRERLTEYIDGEIPPAEVPAVENHVGLCEGCSDELHSLRDEVELVDRALHSIFAAVRPPRRVRPRRRLLRNARPRHRVLALSMAAAVVVVVVAGLLWTGARPSAVESYRQALMENARQGLERIRASKPEEEIVSLETTLLEEALDVACDPAADADAPAWDPRPPDSKRRLESCRYLALLPQSELEELIPTIQDPSLLRFARALSKTPAETSHTVAIDKHDPSGSLSLKILPSGAVTAHVREGPGIRQIAVSSLAEFCKSEPELCRRFGITPDLSSPRPRPAVIQVRDRLTIPIRHLEEARIKARPASGKANVNWDPRLVEMRRRLSAEDLQAARALEQVYEQVLKLDEYCRTAEQ